MAPLRMLKRVSRFPSRTDSYFDTFSYEALSAVSGSAGKSLIESIKSTWHRPSGDNATLEKNLLLYGEEVPSRCNDGDYLAILKHTIDEIRPTEKIVPLTLGASRLHPNTTRVTSPGFPWVNQGYATKGDVYDDASAVGKIHMAWDMIGRGIAWQLPDSMAYHRVVASPQTKTKIRPVWGLPCEVILEESRYFHPLFSELKEIANERDAFYGIGMETYLSGHSHLARNFDTSTVKYNMSGDFTNFDARVPAWLIRDVFAHISSWFDFSRVQDSEGKVWNVKTAQTCRRWKSMISYFINTKIRTPTGLRFQKSQGVPSGSIWTNLIDTICNAVMTRVALRRLSSLPEKDYYYGDDSSVFLREPIDLDAFADILKTTFGAVLSTEKTMLTNNPENIHWLGYYHRTTGPRRSLDFIVASSLFPDREVSHPLHSAARLLGQLYSIMDPVQSVTFFDAIRYLQNKYNIETWLVESYVSALSSKAFKYLQTLGLSTNDISLPNIGIDPFGDRFILDLLPKPSARNFFRRRDHNLPKYAFVAEAYQNRELRSPRFKDFHLFTQTFSWYNEFAEDRHYFTD
uniref:RdRp n=1 Tax=Plasmopara viticola lesion associated Partiti-like 2 TaxID=2689984 RepID=A0A7H0RR14_9VIRU|nr:RdRp [Plasmopara viticola lesion associated Partiti-like 2]